MLLLGTASCILGCLKKKADSEDADELAGLSEAKTKSLPPSTGEKIRKFKHGFRPLGRNKHGKPHMTHKNIIQGTTIETSFISLEMAEGRRKKLMELMKKNGNSTCAECGKKNPDWGSYNIGVFICTSCAGFHRNLGSHISKTKSILLDNWDADQLSMMEEIGNVKAKAKYEMHIPMCYRRPCVTDPDVLKEQFIRAKYEREEFMHVDKQIYTTGFMEVYLWKRGKEDGRFQQRKFVLSESDGTLKYFVKDSHKEPKAKIEISKLNMTFCPKKVGNPNGAQLTYVKDGSTRNIFIYSSSGSAIVDWYMAIRSIKLNKLLIAYPGTSELELSQFLTRDFLKEGWMFKTGPRSSDGYKWRWFTLDDRKLMYLEDPLDPYPKGEVFLGYHADGFAVKKGVPPGMKEQGFGFTLRTKDRIFLFGVQKDEDRTEWMKVLQSVIDRPLTPQDNSMAANLVRKRSTIRQFIY
ncbi:arf-GAP with dual PH domain-containing protein 1 [Caerostris darwini]|uniref:Arf-GAP with dual PH domain-containing protein 1 n=1 Tax=Caerostris darwini TaxID=1538125 RepID=A0AAV4V6P7_9ARAC|nr:arf-GAP with dual PH domain-containing protein 1 [Caerostris darwini]